MSATGYRSEQPARRTIVVIETLDHLRPTSVRVAKALAYPQSANVIICHWHCLNFSNGRVTVRGPVHKVKHDGTIGARIVKFTSIVNAMFFYGPNSGELTERDTAALNRLAAAGIDIGGVPIYKVVDRMMLEGSRRGVVTNALGSSRTWGPKHYQELRLRRYENATGEVIVRPRTLIARPHEVPAVLHVFAKRGETCLVKPAFGEGGRDFHIVRPGESFPQSGRTVVVQQLIPDPLLVEGHKADIRYYLLIDVGDERVSSRLRPVFIRRAAVPYVAQSRPAEITNTSYRLRHGFPPDMRPLDLVPGIFHNLRTQIISQLDSLSRALINAYFWNAARESVDRGRNLVPNRLILFGIDVLVASPSTEPRLYFLELNPFPAFFRGLPDCDQAVDEMLSREYLPLLTRSGRT